MQRCRPLYIDILDNLLGRTEKKKPPKAARRPVKEWIVHDAAAYDTPSAPERGTERFATGVARRVFRADSYSDQQTGLETPSNGRPQNPSHVHRIPTAHTASSPYSAQKSEPSSASSGRHQHTGSPGTLTCSENAKVSSKTELLLASRRASSEATMAIKNAPNPYTGYEACRGTDEEAAKVLYTTFLSASLDVSGVVNHKKLDRKQMRGYASDYSALLNRLRKDIHLMDKRGFSVGILTINAGLYILKAHDLPYQCLYFLQWGRDVFHVKPDVKSYNIAMSATAKLREGHVQLLWKEMGALAIEPNDASYGVLLQNADMASVPAILREKQTKTLPIRLVDYNIIIGKCRSYYEAFPWLKRLQDEQHRPDRYTIGGLLKACSADGDTENVQAVMALAQQGNVPLGTTLWTALLSVYAAAQDYDGFRDVWKRMRSANVAPNQHTYLVKARLLKVCVQAPRDFYCRQVEELVEQAELALCSSTNMWIAVFEALTKVKDVRTANKLTQCLRTSHVKMTPELLKAFDAACLQPFEVAVADKSNLPLWETSDSNWAMRKVRK
ncbi:hypothetical protein DIPPA_14868 [Diplonema papillatum]|nr:hypothetical protein DIPPA_14868 [Diplonema papillatum]